MTVPGLQSLCSTDMRQDTVIRDALSAVRRHLNMPLSYLSIFEGDRVRFSYTSTDADPPFLVEGSARPAIGTYCKAILDGLVPQLLPDAKAHSYASRLEVTNAGPVGAIVSVPIVMMSGRCHGMFCCLDHAPRPDLSDRDHAVMTAFASLVTELLESRTAELEREIEARTRIEGIIASRDFSLVHQPIVNLLDQSVVLFEALCRFGGPNPLPPDQIFAQARVAGLAKKLELCVFHETLASAGQLSGGRGLTMNLSPDVLLTDTVMDIVRSAPMCPNRVIELTEHVDFGDYCALADRMQDLRRLGLKFAVDDFGNGHASLNAVLRLQPDIVKLDRALISRIEQDRASQSLVQAIATFSKDIGATLLAEGVEEASQLEVLRLLDVTLGQGYFFGRPRTPAQTARGISAA